MLFLAKVIKAHPCIIVEVLPDGQLLEEQVILRHETDDALQFVLPSGE